MGNKGTRVLQGIGSTRNKSTVKNTNVKRERHLSRHFKNSKSGGIQNAVMYLWR